MAGRFGGKWVFGLGSLAVAIAALLIPAAARTNHILVIILRVIQGLGQVTTVATPFKSNLLNGILDYIQIIIPRATHRIE